MGVTQGRYASDDEAPRAVRRRADGRHCPAPGLPARPGCPGLKMQATEDKVTLGLAESVLSGNEQAKEIFGFLQSKTFSKDREGFILGDVFADGVVRNGGFSEFSEKVNGRVAQIAFPMAISQTFSEEGDFLDLLAAHPIQALLYSGIILYASLPPLFEARDDDRRSIAVFRAAVPGEYREKIMDLFNKSGLDKIFTEEAELTNSRAAMAAMGVFIVTAS